MNFLINANHCKVTSNVVPSIEIYIVGIIYNVSSFDKIHPELTSPDEISLIQHAISYYFVLNYLSCT